MRTCNKLNPEERGVRGKDPRPKSKKDDRKVEDVGAEGGVQHIVISNLPSVREGEGDMVQVVQMQHQQVLHHLPPGLQLVVEGEQVLHNSTLSFILI